MESIFILGTLYIVADKLSKDTDWLNNLLGGQEKSDVVIYDEIRDYPPNVLGADFRDMGRTSQFQNVRFEGGSIPGALQDNVFYNPYLPLDNFHNVSESHWGNGSFYVPAPPRYYQESGEDSEVHTLNKRHIQERGSDAQKKTQQIRRNQITLGSRFGTWLGKTFSKGTVVASEHSQNEQLYNPNSIGFHEAIVSEDNWVLRELI